MPGGLSSAFNGAAPAGLLQMYAELIEGVALEDPRPSPSGATIVCREPVGVVGPSRRGTTRRCRPWSRSPRCWPRAARSCSSRCRRPRWIPTSSGSPREARLPPGVLDIVPAGRGAGSALVSHRRVDKIGSPGPPRPGRIIGAECGRLVRRRTLEMGGKSASIMVEDGDIATFLAGPARRRS